MVWLLVRADRDRPRRGRRRSAAGCVAALRRVRLATAGLYPVASLAAAALAFGGADTLHGSGFLAVYIAGLMIGTAAIPAQRTVTSFHQGLAWVAQVVLFLTLGLLVFPSELATRARGDPARARGRVRGAAVARVDRDRVRPLVARGARSSRWAGLRGAVPVVLATFPVIDGGREQRRALQHRVLRRPHLDLLQGASFEPLAERLGVTTSEPALPRPLAEAGTIRALGAEVLEFPIGRRRRDGGCARARPRPAARGGRQRHRARERGDPAARVDASARRRRAARARALGDGRRGRHADAPVARRAGRAAAAAAPRQPRGAATVFSVRP